MKIFVHDLGASGGMLRTLSPHARFPRGPGAATFATSLGTATSTHLFALLLEKATTLFLLAPELNKGRYSPSRKRSRFSLRKLSAL